MLGAGLELGGFMLQVFTEDNTLSRSCSIKGATGLVRMNDGVASDDVLGEFGRSDAENERKLFENV